jgi:hypothetical protein
MSIQLITQQDVRPLRRLPFCYICGLPLVDDDVRNDDHVPPSSVFLEADRNHPLILPTHYACNHGQHVQDQQIGQLVGLLHGHAPNPQHQRVQLFGGQGPDGNPFAAAGGFDLVSIIKRWICGFHAALYREPMLQGTEFMTSLPLASLDVSTGQLDPVHEIVPHFVRAIRQNRELGPLDRIECRNGKCLYECVWVEPNDGGRFCVYALDLYGWVTFGDTERFGRRGCVGAYVPPNRQPPLGARLGIQGDDAAISDPLDPFAPSEAHNVSADQAQH